MPVARADTVARLDELRSWAIFEGLLASLAFAQIVAEPGHGISEGAGFAGLLAVVTAAAWAFGPMVRIPVQWCYAGLALVAIAPAIRRYFTSCGAHLNVTAAASAMIVFLLTFVVASAIGTVLLKTWSQLRFTALGVFGSVELLTMLVEQTSTWSEPAATSFGDRLSGLLIAVAAGACVGTVVGLAPKVGVSLVSIAFVAGFLVSWSRGDDVSVCGNSSGSGQVGAVLVSYLVVLLICVLAFIPFRRKPNKRVNGH